MRALLFTLDEDTPEGVHIPFFFDPKEIRGYYRPETIEDIKYFNILINGAVLTLVSNKLLKQYLEKTFKDD